MPVKTLESRTARENWRNLLDTAKTGQADVIITRYGKPITAMIRYEDYVALQEELITYLSIDLSDKSGIGLHCCYDNRGGNPNRTNR